MILAVILAHRFAFGLQPQDIEYIILIQFFQFSQITGIYLLVSCHQ